MKGVEKQSIVERLQNAVNIVHNPYSGWVVLIISIILTIAAYLISSSQVKSRLTERFEFRASEINYAIKNRLSMYEQALWGGVGLFNAKDNVSRKDWKTFVDTLNLKQRLPGIQGMGFSIPVTPEMKNKHIQSIRNEGFPEFTIKPTGSRKMYSSIIYLEPFDWRNQRAFGYDMWSNDMRQQAMLRTRDNGVPSISGIITLVQETEQNIQKGFLFYLPVYKNTTKSTTIQTRQDNFEGWVYAAFRSSDLMQGILGSEDTTLSFEIYDGNEATAESLLYDSDQYPSMTKSNTDYWRFETSINLQGRPWTVIFTLSNDVFSSSQEAKQPLYVLIAGVINDILLFYIIISLHLINRHAREKADKIQRNFNRSQELLTQKAMQVKEAEKVSETFFELAPDAFLVVDANGIIVKANQQAYRLFEFIQVAYVAN